MTLYTTGCPKCVMLKRKLDAIGAKYDVCNDEDKMIQMGMMSAPMLEVDGSMMDFNAAIKYLNTLKGGATA